MAYWLLKSEPDAWSWDQMVKTGPKGTSWTGIRNHTAKLNMKKMKKGDRGFFYHSNVGKEIVGILRVIALAHPDATDATGKWECVDVKAVAPFPRPVTIDQAKANPKLAKMVLVVNSRLSVQPVTVAEWAEICRLGGIDPVKLR